MLKTLSLATAIGLAAATTALAQSAYRTDRSAASAGATEADLSRRGNTAGS